MSLLEDNDKLKLAKAVLNHTKTVANEYIEKHAKSTPNVNGVDINEDKFYEIAMLEIEEDNKVKSTWARALAQTDGNKEKLEPTYIKLRVAELIQEEKERIISYQQFEKQKKIKEEENRQLKLQEELKKQQIIEEGKSENEKLKEWFEKDEKRRIENDKISKDSGILFDIFIIIFILVFIIIGISFFK